VTVCLCVIAPAVAVIVRVNGPVGPFPWVLTVSVEEPVPPAVRAAGLGLNDGEVLFGRPVTLRLTFPLKPLVELRVIVYVVVKGRVTDRLVGSTPNKKSAALVSGVLVGVAVGGTGVGV
jgi:hypothetical protein